MYKNIVILFILPWTIFFNYPAGSEKYKTREQSAPEVKIERPDESRVFQWGSRVRYEITVSDEQDGNSRYGEINPNEVLLEITFVPDENNDVDIAGLKEHKGLSIIRKSTCFSCHADKTSLVGPSFSDIADRYDPDNDTLERLGKRIRNGSSGQWSSIEMPPNEALTKKESEAIADYILKQGSRKHRWIYPGLDGVFRIIDRPENVKQGIYMLNASYVNHGTEGEPGTRLRGEHSIMLIIE